MQLSRQNPRPVLKRTHTDPLLSFPNSTAHLQDVCSGLNSTPPKFMFPQKRKQREDPETSQRSGMRASWSRTGPKSNDVREEEGTQRLTEAV